MEHMQINGDRVTAKEIAEYLNISIQNARLFITNRQIRDANFPRHIDTVKSKHGHHTRIFSKKAMLEYLKQNPYQKKARFKKFDEDSDDEYFIPGDPFEAKLPYNQMALKIITSKTLTI
jgi:hypothetical protein